MSFSEMHTSSTGGTRGFSCPTKGFEDQKPSEPKSALTVDKPSPKDDHNEPETNLQRDDFNNKFDLEDNEDMNAKTKTNQREKRTINPFTFLKEELLKVFKDKDTDLEPEGCLSTQNDVNISSSKDRDISNDSKTNWTAEKPNNNLNLLKGDPSVARIDGLKEKEVKEDSSKITDLKAERTNEPFTRGFKGDQKLLKISEKVDNGQEVKNVLSEKKEEHLDCGFGGNFEENNEEEINAEKMKHIKDRKDQPGDSELDVSEEKSEPSLTEKQKSDENMCTSNTSRPGGFFQNLFKRDQKPLRTSDKEDKRQVIITVSEKKDKQVDSGVRGNLSEQNKDKNLKDRMNQPRESDIDPNVEKPERTSFSETKQSQEMMSMSNTSGPTGFSCSAPGSGDQKPRKSISALIVDEPSQENNHRESETCFQEDKLTHEHDQQGHGNVKIKDHLKTNYRVKSINPLTLLKEDLLKVFQDKHIKSELEDSPLRQTENISTGSILNLSQSKEDINFNVSSSKDKGKKSSDFKTSQAAEKSENHLSLLEDSSKISDLIAERTNEPFTNQFERDQQLVKTFEKVEDNQDIMLLEKKEEPLDSSFRENLMERNKDNLTAKPINNITDQKDQPEDSELDLNVSEEKSEPSLTEKQKSDENMWTSNTSRPGGFFKNLFRRDQKPLRTSDKEDKPQVIITVSEKKDKQVESGVRGNLSEQNKDKKIKDRMNQPEESDIDPNVSEEKSERTSFEEMMSMSNTSGPTGFSYSSAGLGNQKTRKSKSALIVEEPLQENNHRESQTCLQEDALTHKPDQKGLAHVKMKELKVNQREKRIDPMNLLKEDLFEVFKDKHTESELDDCPLRRTENLSTGSTPSFLKEDLSHLSKDKDVKSSDLNTSQTAEKSDNHLRLLKDDPSNVTRTVCLKEKDTEENSSEKTDLKTERINEPFKNLFGRDQKLVKTEKIEDRKKEEPLDSGFRGTPMERDEENVNAETINNITEQIDQSEDSKLDLKVSEEKSEIGFSEKQQSDEMMCTSNTSSPGGFFRKLFRRDEKALGTSDKLQRTQDVSHMHSERKEEKLYSGFMGNLTENNKANNVKDRRNQPKHRELDINVSDWTTFSETQQSEMTFTIKTGRPKGFPSSTTCFGAQKPTESKSILIVDEHSQEKEHKESEIHLQEDDLTHRFDQKDNKEKDVNVQDFLRTNQSEKRTTGTITLLKEDFSHFKEDFFNVFRISLSKEEDSSQFEVPVPEDTKEPFKKEEQLDSDFRRNLNAEDMVNIKGRTDQPEDSELGLNFSEEELETSFSEVQQSEETMSVLDTGGDTTEDEKTNVDEENKPSEILSWDSSMISLLNLRYANKDNMRGQAGGDLWSPKNFATYLTFDPNTANSELHLMEGNRTATRYWLGHRYLDHPERFQHCPQVLCREGLLDSVYWEVEWSGGADIGVAYNSISRDGDTSSCLLGHNEYSWSLECSEGSYTPCYNKRRFKSSSPEPFTHRVGIYLDWSAGTLSFYCVSQDTMVPLHTFTSTFTEPLYAGFWIWAYKGSVSLRQVELDWERLQ